MDILRFEERERSGRSSTNRLGGSQTLANTSGSMPKGTNKFNRSLLDQKHYAQGMSGLSQNNQMLDLKEWNDTQNPQKVDIDVEKSIIKIDFQRNNVYIMTPPNVRLPRVEENKKKNTIFIDLNMEED